MTITRVQGNAVASSGTVTSLAGTLSVGVTSGNLLVAAVSTGAIGNAVTPPTGWTQAVFNQPNSPSNNETGLWWAIVGSGGLSAGSTSWTFTFATAHNSYIIIEEWSATNGWLASPVDVTAVGNTAGTATTATTIVSGTTATTAQASELWVASLAYSAGVQTESSITAGWTKDLETHDSGNNHTVTMLYQVASATGTAACQYTIGTAEHWAGCVATFKPVVGTQVTKDTTFRGVLSKATAKDTTFRGVISKAASKNTVFRGNTGHTAIKDSTWRAVLAAIASKNTAWRGSVSNVTRKDTRWRSNIGRTTAKDTSFRGVVSKAIAKDTTFRGKVGHSATHDTVFRANLTAAIISGGFALLANTAIGSTGVQFANLRATQYPDPALNLAPVLPRLGSSSASWNATIPTNTTLGVKTSLDAVTWTTATSGASIPGLNGQPDPTIDLWTSNTLANYTNTSKSGGSAATVTYDTTNSRISLVGGSGGVYLNNAISSADIDLICDMDRSDAGGLVWRYIDANNYYELGCYDDSASGGFTNALRLYKVASGVRSLLGTASVISWPRATPATSPYKRTRVTMLGAIITVYFDGVQMQTYTDGSPLAAGKCGLRNDGGTSRYYQLRIQPQGDYVSGTPASDFSTSDFVYTQVTMTTSDPSVTPSLQDLTTSARSPQIATGALITQLHDPSKPFAAFYNTEMTSIATTSGDYWWNVNSSDNPGALIFNKREANPALFCLHSSDLLLTPTGATAATVQPTASADLYRNQQIITNCIDTVAISGEQKIADGTATSWGLKYPLYSAPTITVQGVSKTVGVKGVDTGKDFYWQAANNTISQDSGATKIPSGYVMSFTYVGQFDTIVTRNNLAEQATRAAIENNSGIVAAIEDGKGMLASNAIVYADGLLARYGNNNTVELIAATLRSGLEEGMLLPVFLPEHKLNNEQLLIVKLTTTAVLQADGTALYQYEIDATNGPNLSNWSAALGI